MRAADSTIRSPVGPSEVANRLVEYAQSGFPAEALAEAEVLLRAADRPHPALHFARAVALEVLGRHHESADAAASGVDEATRARRTGWRAACLAMHALQLIADGDGRRESFDEGEVLRDLAQARMALATAVADDAEDTCDSERIAACCNLAAAYTRLRLYELALPMHEAAAPSAGSTDSPPEAPAVQQINLATLHLTWTLELLHVGETCEAQRHARLALGHARAAEQLVDGPHREVWATRARLFAGCARTHGDDPLGGVASVLDALDALAPVGVDYERLASAAHVALALADTDRVDEAMTLLEDAMAAPPADPVARVATQWARLVLMAPTSAGARAGLELSDGHAAVLWLQRTRRLATAEALLRYERLRAEHEVVARESELDALTGVATRRALDRRMQQLADDDGDAPVCVLVVDLDGLKTVNDTLGHAVGDLVLRQVGRALADCVRGEDLLGRFGGDEFVALLSTSPTVGRIAAGRMLAAVRRLTWPAELEPGAKRPTVSIGIAVASAGQLDHAMVAADRAMYTAKRSGGDTVVVAPASPDDLGS